MAKFNLMTVVLMITCKVGINYIKVFKDVFNCFHSSKIMLLHRQEEKFIKILNIVIYWFFFQLFSLQWIMTSQLDKNLINEIHC